ncbi:MAG TPA: DinB family protein [Rhodanobacteraceae bacterium]|nr:DinB family protein [Rhodanobacteraceae bacterium]
MAGAAGQACAIESLARYKAWADQTLYAALADMPTAQLAAPTRIFAGSILRTLHHVLLIDVVWKAHLLGVPHAVTDRNPQSAPPFAELRARQQAIDGWYARYAATLPVDARAERIDFTFIGGGEGQLSRSDVLQHVVNHTTYHRGHITGMLWLAGIRPPTTDLPVYHRDAT